MYTAHCVRVKLLAVWLAVSGAVTVPPWTIQQAQQQGPNVCVLEEIPGTKYKLWTECKYWAPRSICGQPPTLRYECCGGYTRVPGEHGCTAVNQLENVLETAKNLGAREFVRYIEESGDASSFTKGGPITLFAPSDEAFQEMNADNLRRLGSWRGSGLNSLLLYHSVPARLYSNQFKGDLLVDSRQPNTKLRINKFSSKIDTVNCARILRKDEEATNGVVHIIDAVLDPETWQGDDIVETITRDGRFSQFARAIETTGVSRELRYSGQPVTIFVPSDEAFDNLSSDHLYRLTNDRTVLAELVRSHIVPHPLCLPAIIAEQLKLRSQSEHVKLDLSCESGRYALERKRLGNRFVNTPHGIIHPIEHLILPQQVKTTDQLLDRNNTRTFRTVFRISDLERTLRDSRPYTLFAPTDQAMASLPHNYLQMLRTNRAEARKFCTSHVLRNKFTTENIVDNQAHKSMDASNDLVFQVHKKGFGVNGAIIEKGDTTGLDCTVHIISRVLVPPSKSLQRMLQGNSTVSSFLQALEMVRQYDPRLLEGKPTKTILIPTNQAFYRSGLSHMANQHGNLQYTSKVLRNHIIEGLHSSESFHPNLHYTLKTNGNDVKINKQGGRIRVNGEGEILESDIETTDGLVHIIDIVLVPADYRQL